MKAKFLLAGGICVGRFICENINTKYCDPYPKDGEEFVLCDNYKRRDEKPLTNENGGNMI